MNPLTLVKRIQQINSKEASLGISENASWHTKYKESAYVFVGGIPFDLTEGDLLAVFAQYGEIVDVNLVRDKGTGKSKGFAFIAYEDQRSTNLAVDNLNGAQILGRIVRVDHVTNYKKKEEEDEEAEQKKREERGVCRAFQKGECTRGAGCKFSHDEQRAANTGWGAEDQKGQWGHDRYEGGPQRSERRKPDVPRPQVREVHNNNNKSSTRQQRGGVGDGDEPRRSRDRSEDNKRGRGGIDERRYDDGGVKDREDGGDRVREEKRSRRRSEDGDFEGRRRDDYREMKEEKRRRESRDVRREENKQEPESHYYSKEDEDRKRKRRGGRSGYEDGDGDHPSIRHRNEKR